MFLQARYENTACRARSETSLNSPSKTRPLFDEFIQMLTGSKLAKGEVGQGNFHYRVSLIRYTET